MRRKGVGKGTSSRKRRPTKAAVRGDAARRSLDYLWPLIQGVKEYAIYMLDREGNILSWNEGAERLKGYKAEEVLGKNYALFFSATDQESGKPETQLRKAAREGQAEDEGWRVRKDGTRFWANAHLTALGEGGNIRGFAKITRDMGERREREESVRNEKKQLEFLIVERTAELIDLNRTLQSEVRERQKAEEQLRAFAARLQSVREDERTRLAREIHDALGQMCTALKMDIVWIAKRLSKDQKALHDKTDSALKVVAELIKSLRQLSAELRPSTLDTLGLVSAIEWQAQEFEARTGIRCQFSLPEKDPTLDRERSTAVFRIFQETLTNVARHAEATTVQTSLAVADREIILTTRDNGRGFDAESSERKGSLGLLGMRERAHLLGGEVEISSAPSKGTKVTVHIPLT